MKNIRPLLSLLAIAAALAQTTARADSAAGITTGYAFNSAVVYDDNGTGNNPVVSAILSAPSGTVYNPGATLDGYTYFNWSYLAQDTTGSLDLFYNVTKLSYVPTVGDVIQAQGVWSPFSGIAEVASGNGTTTPTISILVGGSGSPLYNGPVLTTIPTINVGTNAHGINSSGLATQLLTLNNVTISGVSNIADSGAILSNWAIHANNQGLITDQGGHSMAMFLWASSYSACGAIAQNGDPIPTGQVNMTGFVEDFYTGTASNTTIAEFVPISITSVPEPAAIGLCGLGSVLAWVCYRRNKKA
jgi:hypothetical protein